MSNRLRPALKRPAALVIAALLPASLTLTACGDDDGTLQGLDAVTISGKVGAAPEVKWKGIMEAGKSSAKVLTKGSGQALAKDDVVRVDYTLVNGYTKKTTYDSYAVDGLGALVKVGAKKEPQSIADLLTAAVAAEIEAGQTIGSRIAVTVGSDRVFGDYLGDAGVAQFVAGLDIGNEDGLLFVADLVSLAGPEGAAGSTPKWAPKIIEADGVPTGLDFSDAPKPSGKLEVATLIKGTGPVVKSGQKILASYLGQIPKGKTPFDESYSTGRGLEAVVGGDAASVVDGWSRGLVGLPVGSRVLLQIPPKLGYGAEAQGDIPANSTLYFIVDILDVAEAEAPVDPDEAPAPVEPAESSAAPASPSAEATE